MTKKRRLLGSLKLTAGALAMSLGLGAAANAAPLLSFTWNPSAVTNSTQGAFTANQFALQDFATINVPSNPSTPGSVTESGFLLPGQFNLVSGGTTTLVTTANIPGVSSFGIYESFSATSNLIPCTLPSGSGLCGKFQSVTASVYVYSTAGGAASVTFASPTSAPTLTLPTGANPVLVATETGPIGGSPNFVQIISGVPGASVDTLFKPEAGASGFFVSPAVTMALDLQQVFTNTVGVITTSPSPCPDAGTSCIYQIHGGGGNGNFFSVAVPEPGSLALLGFGVAALGFIRRRRA